jgi:hypothetical protein
MSGVNNFYSVLHSIFEHNISQYCHLYLYAFKGYLSLYGYRALCWALSAFQFPKPTPSRYDSLDRGPARRKAATFTQHNTNTE